MKLTLDIVIFLLGMATYTSAVLDIRRSGYSPSLFTRAIWMLLGINSFIGVAFGGGSFSSKLLALTLLLGNSAVFFASIRKGSREFGVVEQISLLLFIVSCVLLFTSEDPMFTLVLTLVARFIGGTPTIWRTIKNPASERALHWYLFTLASALTVLNSDPRTLRAILFPIYFIGFNGLIILLVNRRRIGQLITGRSN